MKRWVIAVVAASMAVGCGGLNNPGMLPGSEPPRIGLTMTVDDMDRRPIAGARVEVDLFVLPPTDASGQTAGSIPRGWHTLRIKAPGYCPQMWTIDLNEQVTRSYGVSLDREPCSPENQR